MDAVILAAGEGTRLRPLTATRPKPMLPVGGKPILEWNLLALKAAGIRKVVLVVGYKRDVIEEYFQKSYQGMRIEYVVQEEQLGTGHALSLADGLVHGEILVMNGDLLVSAKTIKDLLADHRRAKARNSMALIKVSDPEQFGIVVVKNRKVRRLIEKPRSTRYGNLANAGIYIFDEDIFSRLKKVKKSVRFEYEITSAIEGLVKEGIVHGFTCSDLWIDIGRPWDLLVANEIMVKSMSLKKDAKATVEKFAVLKGKVGVGRGSVIRSGAYIEGPVLIGEDCVVGPNCFLRAHTVLMDGVKVGNAVEIKNSIVMQNTHIGHLSYVGDSIIGEGCNFGAGTKVANLKFDDSHVNVDIKGKRVSSGRRKMGVIMADGVKTGINVSIMPGRSIYPGAFVEAGSLVRYTIYTEVE